MSTKLPLDDLVGAAGLSFTIELEGDVFGLVFRYNDREARYYVALFDENDVALIVGVKVLLGIPLFDRLQDARRPKGDFLAVGGADGAEPTLGTLGAGVDVVFVPWFESAGLR